MDHIWQISIDKKDAKLPQNLKVRLKKQLESIHIKSKKVYRRRSTPLNIGDHSSAWTKVKKAGRTKFEINRSSKMVKSLIAKLDDEANESLEFLLRYIEQMLPVNSIVDTHTDTTQEVIQTETSNSEARLAAAYIVKTFHAGFEGNDEEFKEEVLKSAYFNGSKKLALEALSDFFGNEVTDGT